MHEIVSRRAFIRTAALGSAGLALARPALGQPARFGRKPNLVVLLPDQQRADTLACYGGAPEFAPNLNKLASQSFVFQHAYVTHPLCTPSRSSLLTGTWPHANGCTRNNIPLRREVRCLPELINDSDYTCAYMGKWHLGNELLGQHGFSHWVSILEGRVSRLEQQRQETIACDYDRFLTASGLIPDLTTRGIFSRSFATHLPLELSRPMFLQTNACQFLEQHQRDPFVLFVAFYEPHPPYNGPLNHEHPLDRLTLDSTTEDSFAADMPLRYRLRQEWDRRRYGTTRERRLKIKQRYLGLVTEIDRAIGAILQKLEQLDILDNTIVVHTSDHGDMMGTHQLFGKEVLFQDAVRVPYLVRLPDQRRTVSIQRPVSHIDFVPTMLELLGKGPDPQCAGTSRADWFRGEPPGNDAVFIERSPVKSLKVRKRTQLAGAAAVKRALGESTRAMISPDGWKLCLRDADKNELYNLNGDPSERVNLYPHRESRHVIGRLTAHIHRWQEKNEDKVQLSMAV